MENLLDFVFLRLGINDEGAVKHGIVMTEALCNPTYNRKSTSLKLFERLGMKANDGCSNDGTHV